MEIGQRSIGADDPPFFIAEAGVNHNGDIEIAKELIEVAADAGADAVKFQTFTPEQLVTERSPQPEYQDIDMSQYEMLKEYELSRESHITLQEKASSLGIRMLSTPFDNDSLRLLDELGFPAIKIGSGELTNLPLLEAAANIGRPLILSTGMGTLSEVETAYQRIVETNRTVSVALLHCVSAYPASIDDVHLRAMHTLSERFEVPVGFSDHTTAVETPGLAVAAGAHIVEKHFTLDTTMPGPDHEASLEPPELDRAVDIVDTAARALGTPEKKPVAAERSNRQRARRSIHAATEIEPRMKITEEDLVIARPAAGLPPDSLTKVVGRRPTKPLAPGEPITEAVLKDR
jgi:N-acetylneuraminate synthase/N,N'-diacetyllegionaminate synthase